jgi:hypothetical protein
MNDQDERPISDAQAERLRRALAPPPDLEERTRDAIMRDLLTQTGPVRFPVAAGGMKPGRLVAALAALTIVPVIIAFGLGRATAPRSSDLSGAYLLLIESTPGQPAMTPEEAAARVGEYGSWARSLRERNLLLSAERLDAGGSVVLTSGTTAPLAAADDRLGGFFIVRAVDMDNALSIARESPHVRLGGRIVVRRIASASNR